MLDHLRALNAGEEPLGSFGAVIGATIGESRRSTSTSTARSWRPGFGAQGGTVADIRRIFGSAVAAVTPSSSRELLRRGPSVDRDARRGAAPQRRAAGVRFGHPWPHRLALLLAAACSSTGCADQKEKYCDAVKDHQQELGEVLGDGGPDALLKALPIFRDLADEAPDDIRDEWRTVIDAVEGLAAGAGRRRGRPGDVRPGPPAGGLSQADQDAIDAAARRLTSEQTVAAFNGVDQQAKDVCGTPLQV